MATDPGAGTVPQASQAAGTAEAKEGKQGNPNNARLTPEIVDEIESRWKLSGEGETILSDAEIAIDVGINPKLLAKAVYRNRKVTRKNGQVEGMGDIRARAKGRLLVSYLTRLESMERDAAKAGDFKTAARLLVWKTEKRYPKRFGHLAGKGDGETEGEESSAEYVRQILKEVNDRLCPAQTMPASS